MNRRMAGLAEIMQIQPSGMHVVVRFEMDAEVASSGSRTAVILTLPVKSISQVWSSFQARMLDPASVFEESRGMSRQLLLYSRCCTGTSDV